MPPGLRQRGSERGPGPWRHQPCCHTSFGPEGFPSRFSPCSLNVSITPRAGVGAGVPAQRSGDPPGVLARLGRDPPRGGRWPRHAKRHAPGHPCPRCHANGSMVVASTPAAGLATGVLPWRPRARHGRRTPARGTRAAGERPEPPGWEKIQRCRG